MCGISPLEKLKIDIDYVRHFEFDPTEGIVHGVHLWDHDSWWIY